MMQVDVGLFYFDVVVLIVLVLMAMVYTYYHIGTTGVLKDKYKYGFFGVFSFIMIGFMMLGYIVWVYISSYTYPVPIPFGSDQTADLAHGFFTVIVAAAVGIALTVFGVMKYSHFGRKKLGVV